MSWRFDRDFMAHVVCFASWCARYTFPNAPTPSTALRLKSQSCVSCPNVFVMRSESSEAPYATRAAFSSNPLAVFSPVSSNIFRESARRNAPVSVASARAALGSPRRSASSPKVSPLVAVFRTVFVAPSTFISATFPDSTKYISSPFSPWSNTSPPGSTATGLNASASAVFVDSSRSRNSATSATRSNRALLATCSNPIPSVSSKTARFRVYTVVSPDAIA
mmetsp:Transcript_13642/g.51033  ORF Transcript_13642/g.51033 Transcript_13642/m.51033 type:complete len:221 (+) Transcript_13642:1505-2167(+)